MSILEAPKNLTRNVLIGMALGVLIASFFHYHQNSTMLFDFVEKYVSCVKLYLIFLQKNITLREKLP